MLCTSLKNLSFIWGALSLNSSAPRLSIPGTLLSLYPLNTASNLSIYLNLNFVFILCYPTLEFCIPLKFHHHTRLWYVVIFLWPLKILPCIHITDSITPVCWLSEEDFRYFIGSSISPFSSVLEIQILVVFPCHFCFSVNRISHYCIFLLLCIID